MSSDEHMMLDRRKPETRSHCIRCGECCLRSSPTLQAEDLCLIEKGILELRDLVTIRKGEFVTDPVKETVGPAACEWIKVKEKEGAERGCIFYDVSAKACSIYDDRPSQCRALACWDTRRIVEVLGGPKLRRRDAVRDGVLLGLMERHEERCSHADLHGRVLSIPSEGETAVVDILDQLKFDHSLRPFVSAKLNVPMDQLDFYFGRPLVETIGAYGLRVARQPDGTFLLTKMRKNGVME